MIDLLVQMGVPEQRAGDIWLLILFAVASLILIALVKKRNLGSLLISVYVVFAITIKSSFTFLENSNAKVVYFLIIILVVFSLFKRLFKINITGKKMTVWIKTILFSFAILGLLASIIMTWLPARVVEASFSVFSLQLFLSDGMQLFWMVIPLFLVSIFKYRQ